MPITSVSDPALFKRPYSARRKRNAAKRLPTSPVSKLLLRVLAVLLLLVSATVAVIATDTEQRPIATSGARLQGPQP